MLHGFLPAPLALLLLPAALTAQFTDWSTPVNMGPVVNSPYVDSCVTVAKNGLSMFFFSSRYAQNTSAPWHLYVSQRPSQHAPWGIPQEIAGFNDGLGATCPALSPDEHRLYFSSNRAGGCGGSDIWVSRRHDRRDDFGWQPPVNLGCTVNSSSYENLPSIFEDDNGTEVLYFGSGRANGPGNGDIWESRMQPDGSFGPPKLIAELSTTSSENGGMGVRRDGLEIVFGSNRPGGPFPGTADLWTASRESTSDLWSAPVPLTGLSSASFDGGRMSFSFDGRTLYFISDRPGGVGSRDLYYSTREKKRN